MCGQAGIVFGKKRRSKKERFELLTLFKMLLILNQKRGVDATGVALVNAHGGYQLYKTADSANKFLRDKDARSIINVDELTEQTTLLAGHTRWATVGSPKNSRNNHPIVAGSIIGTHNGTITNADAVAKTLGVQRRAKVDSEVIFRIASTLCLNAGRIDMDKIKENMHLLRGEMSSIMVSRHDPKTVIILKGTKPLALRYCKKARAVIYSSEAIHLDAVVAGSSLKWERLTSKKNSYLRFNHANMSTYFKGKFEIQKALPKYKSFRNSRSSFSSLPDDWADSKLYNGFEDGNLAMTYYPADEHRKKKKKKRKKK